MTGPVLLLDSMKVEIGSTLTDSGGKYFFASFAADGRDATLEPNTDYTLRVVLADLPRNDIEATVALASTATGKTDSDGIVSGDGKHVDIAFQTGPLLGYFDDALDFGFSVPTLIGDRIFRDANGDGFQVSFIFSLFLSFLYFYFLFDVGYVLVKLSAYAFVATAKQNRDETGVGDIAVQLLDASSRAVLSETASDANGRYVFAGGFASGALVELCVSLGDVNAQALGELTPTVVRAGGAARFDDDSDGTFDAQRGACCSGAFRAPSAGEPNDLSRDFGFAPRVALGGKVFFDLNDNGLSGDDGAAGVGPAFVRVQLLRADESDNEPLSTTLTAAGGAYRFSSGPLLPALRADTAYRVRLDVTQSALAVNAWQPARVAVGTDATRDSDGVPQPGALRFVDAAVRSPRLAQPEPLIGFDFGLVRRFELGDRVWLDANDNGVQDAREAAGVDGVRIVLLDPLGAVVARTVTSGGGRYRFDSWQSNANNNLRSNVDYRVSLDRSAPANVYTPARSARGVRRDLDSNGVPTADGASIDAVVTITPSRQSNLTVDFGLVPSFRIAGRVFLDNNANGMQEIDE